MTKEERKKCIALDSGYYNLFPMPERIKMMVTADHFYKIHQYMKYLRYEEYYRSKSRCSGVKGIASMGMEWVYARKKNRLGNILGFYIKPGCLGAGTTIYHHGTIIIHGEARLGTNCRLHGNNCIGNDGKNSKAPVIGNNVELGFGAMVLGEVHIADDVKIGAGAVVVESCEKKGATLIGVPAREVL